MESIMFLKSVSFNETDITAMHFWYISHTLRKLHRTHQQTIKFYIALLEYVVIIDCVKIKVKRNI